MNAVGLARIAVGAALLARPGLPARLTATAATRGVRLATRVLGARYLGQGVLDLVAPAHRRLDASVECLHAVSMLPLAWMSPRHARLALLSAAVATGFAVAEEGSRR